MSVLASARTSTSSIFDVVTDTADVFTQALRQASRAMDMLDEKTNLMHQRVKINCRAQLTVVQVEEILLAARKHVELLEQHYRFAGKPLTDEQKLQELNDAVAAITEAVGQD